MLEASLQPGRECQRHQLAQLQRAMVVGGVGFGYGSNCNLARCGRRHWSSLQGSEINPRPSRRGQVGGGRKRNKEEREHKQRHSRRRERGRGANARRHAWQSQGCAEAEGKLTHLYALEWQLSLVMSNNKGG